MQTGLKSVSGGKVRCLFAILLFASTAKADVFHGVGGDMIPVPNEIEYQAEHGATTVRLMIFIDPANVHNWGEWDYFQNVALWLQWFDYLIPFYREQNIKVILNMPFTPGGLKNGQTLRLFDKDRHGNRHWGYQYFINMWRYIADRYKDEDVVYGFDLLNEPHNGATEVWRLQEAATLAIRGVSNKVVFQTNKTGQCRNFKSMRRSIYQNVKYTCHDYDPFKLTHQGTKPSRPIKYKYPSSRYSKRNLTNSLRYVRQFARKVGPENIYIGEGAISKVTDPQSQQRWTKDLLDLTRGYNWTYFFVTGQAWRDIIWEPSPALIEQLEWEMR